MRVVVVGLRRGGGGIVVQERYTNQSHDNLLVSITMKNGSSDGINPERVGKKAIALPVNDSRYVSESKVKQTIPFNAHHCGSLSGNSSSVDGVPD